jgi:hypothetical protein
MFDQAGALALLLAIVLVAGVLLLRLRGQGGAALVRELQQVAEARAERDGLIADIATLGDDALRARADRAAALAQLEPGREQVEELRARVAAAERELAGLEAQLGRTRSLRDAETASLARQQALRAETEAAVRAARAALEDGSAPGSLPDGSATARRSGAQDAPRDAHPTRRAVDLGAVEASIGKDGADPALSGLVTAMRTSAAMPALADEAVRDGTADGWRD